VSSESGTYPSRKSSVPRSPGPGVGAAGDASVYLAAPDTGGRVRTFRKSVNRAGGETAGSVLTSRKSVNLALPGGGYEVGPTCLPVGPGSVQLIESVYLAARDTGGRTLTPRKSVLATHGWTGEIAGVGLQGPRRSAGRVPGGALSLWLPPAAIGDGRGLPRYVLS